jgi:hypothetical protein
LELGYNRSRNGMLPASFERTTTNPVRAACDTTNSDVTSAIPRHR